jgi:hypothetical protein
MPHLRYSRPLRHSRALRHSREGGNPCIVDSIPFVLIQRTSSILQSFTYLLDESMRVCCLTDVGSAGNCALSDTSVR